MSDIRHPVQASVPLAAIPERVLRFFRQESHARSFVTGQIRFGSLDRYRTIEGARRDETEGRVSLLWNLENPVYCQSSSLNPFYILSSSHLDADRRVLRQRFGEHVVEIEDTRALLERINIQRKAHPAFLTECTIEAVPYDKDKLVDPKPYLIPPYEYSCCQKPRRFEDEREIRYILRCDVGTPLPPDPVVLEVGDCRDICRLI